MVELDFKSKFITKMVGDVISNTMTSFTVYVNKEKGLITLDDHNDNFQSYEFQITKK